MEIYSYDEKLKKSIYELLNQYTNFISIDDIKIVSGRKTLELSYGKIKRFYNISEKDADYKIRKEVYKFLSDISKVSMPWGMLTGIKPMKLYRNLEKDKRFKILAEKYFIKEEKIKLLDDIYEEQNKIKIKEKFSIYIHIPFCPSICSYCSFYTNDISKHHYDMSSYVKSIINEMQDFFSTCKEREFSSIYIGGGTPSVLSPDDLNKLLSYINNNFKSREFTFEAGRPDTINKDLLDILFKNKVDRISINPQTFKNETLKLINRRHGEREIVKAYEEARKYPFIINMDMIAGLPYENIQDVRNTLKKIIELKADNITIHNLALKKKSCLSKNRFLFKDKEEDYKDFYINLYERGYRPYYLYRQKNTHLNLENVSFSVEGKQSLYNIVSIEDSQDILAFGAGAVSKFIEEDGVKRIFNYKDISLYMKNIDTEVSKKIGGYYGKYGKS